MKTLISELISRCAISWKMKLMHLLGCLWRQEERMEFFGRQFPFCCLLIVLLCFLFVSLLEVFWTSFGLEFSELSSIVAPHFCDFLWHVCTASAEAMQAALDSGRRNSDSSVVRHALGERVLGWIVFLSTWHKLELLAKKKSQLRKGFR